MAYNRIEGTECGVAIYALCDPLTEEIRYIGQTSRPAGRYEQHVWSARYHGQGGSPKDAWIASLLARGVDPVFYWLDWVWAEDADGVEREQIATHRAQGCSLFNGSLVLGKPVHVGTTVSAQTHDAISDVAFTRGVSFASAVRFLLEEALAARAAAAPTPEPESEEQSAP